MTTVGDVVSVLEAAYRPSLAEEWDSGIGLTCGDRNDEVRRVLLAVDVDPATVAQAREIGADLLVTHHPLLFRAVHSVAADTPRGYLVHQLIRSGIAHFAAHTNADRAADGVNDALAQTLGLVDTRPLAPALGNDGVPSSTEGLGRIGTLPTLPGENASTVAQFARQVAAALPSVAGGIRAAGDPQREVRSVAVCGGSGGSLLDAAADADVDVYLTSELGHHLAGEFLAMAGRPALIEVAHFAGEWPWLERAAAVVRAAFPGSVATTVSTLCTDPWGLHVASPVSTDPRWSV